MPDAAGNIKGISVPALPPTMRSERIAIWVTPAEKTELQGAADRAGVELHVLIHNRLFAGSGPDG